jgi:hypothetical protein
MPLSSPVARAPLHTRTVTCNAFHRDDDLIDIEGHMTDVKAYEIPNRWRGPIGPGAPIHDMWLRLTLDRDFTIIAVEAVTDSSPFATCPAVTINFQRLKGVHLVELLGPMATTAYQSMWGLKARDGRRDDGQDQSQKVSEKPPRLLNSCWAYSDRGELVREHYPAFYQGDAADQ